MQKRRVLKEIERIQGAGKAPGLDPGQFRVHIGGDITSWRVLMKGPSDTPYEKGVFDLTVNLPATYPHDPPEIVFVTRVWHPNVTPEGDICMSRLKKGVTDGWVLGQTMGPMLLSVQLLLAEANPSDPFNGEAARQYVDHREDFNAKAADMTERFAYDLEVLDRSLPMPETKSFSREDLVESIRSHPVPTPPPPPSGPPPSSPSSRGRLMPPVTNPFFLTGVAPSGWSNAADDDSDI